MTVSDREMEAPAMVKQQKEIKRTERKRERERMTKRNEEEEEAGSRFKVLYLFYRRIFHG